ncbi:hypothetical protein PEL8287_02679 [Roseovarius litorisediminis]|uniref:Uncharacterized protein n=1 Tax=Roseovarius litorisediminis TaxID=1312363 RepID=A0A1Y5SXP8_9RHOB|nr:hypothetical protein [Roseovarius litorisediminis]SLN51071.1 hypothetical protein PEL8287_02679 [Roseovarius litorisediminis]
MKHHFLFGLVLAFMLTAPALAGPVSIGFEGPPEGPAPTDMSEDGYTIVAKNMAISSSLKSGDGTDGSNEIESIMGANGTLTITRPGVPFRFVSLDWQAENATATIRVQGFRNGKEVAIDTYTVTGPSGYIHFRAEALSGATLDKLVIHPQRDQLGVGALDAVVLDEAPGNLQTSDNAPVTRKSMKEFLSGSNAMA